MVDVPVDVGLSPALARGVMQRAVAGAVRAELADHEPGVDVAAVQLRVALAQAFAGDRVGAAGDGRAGGEVSGSGGAGGGERWRRGPSEDCSVGGVGLD